MSLTYEVEEQQVWLLATMAGQVIAPLSATVLIYYRITIQDMF